MTHFTYFNLDENRRLLRALDLDEDGEVWTLCPETQPPTSSFTDKLQFDLLNEQLSLLRYENLLLKLEIRLLKFNKLLVDTWVQFNQKLADSNCISYIVIKNSVESCLKECEMIKKENDVWLIKIRKWWTKHEKTTKKFQKIVQKVQARKESEASIAN